jgi:flagellar biosynthesis/type III secretory pathway chaperone
VCDVSSFADAPWRVTLLVYLLTEHVMQLEKSIKIALELKTLLEDEIKNTQEGILQIRQLDMEAVQERGQMREVFNQRAGILEEDLMKAMETAGKEAKIKNASLGALQKAYKGSGDRLAAIIKDIQACASQIKQMDAFNQTLMERALSFVRSYLDCLNPSETVYNKRGILKKSNHRALGKVVNVSHRV